ncbi:MAG: tRNA pseudouridine(38-40) synthase TruA [Candidatus Ornithospirochaeta sp.]
MPHDKRRIALTVSYDGRFWHGWQIQENAPSVEGEIEDALSTVLGEYVFVQGSGRTDAGVHALGQVAHFDTSSSIPAEKFAVILNTMLPKSIRILSSWEPEGVFHARFTAMAREYWYYLKRMDQMLPFDEGRVTGIRELPDINLPNSYASLLAGTHDFTTFCSARDMSQSRKRDIYESRWQSESDKYGFPVYRYKVAGNAFLYRQVRSMVGTMVEAALSGEDCASFKSRLDSVDRNMALKTAPSDGLYLARISYDENEYLWFEEGLDGRQQDT